MGTDPCLMPPFLNFPPKLSSVNSRELAESKPVFPSLPDMLLQHPLLNGFKNLLAISCATGFEFKEATKFLAAAKNAPAAGAAGGPAKAAAVVEEKKEEPEAVDMCDLFGGDDEY